MIQRGSKVCVPEGTAIHGTFPGGHKRAGRTYTVTIKAFDPGYPGTSMGPGREDQVVWAGSGGYWHYAKASDVEER